MMDMQTGGHPLMQVGSGHNKHSTLYTQLGNATGEPLLF